MNFSELPEFEIDLKRLSKRFRSLQSDLETLKKVLVSDASHPQPPRSFRLSGLGFDSPVIIKVKKFACKALKGRGANSGIRIIYAYHAEQQLIQFVQIYFKGDEENEDRERIAHYFKKRGNA